MITQMDISLLIRLIIAHLLTDFVFQSDSWINKRFKNGWHSKHLYLHGIIAGMLAFFFSGLLNLIWIPVAVAVTHVLIDGIKAKYENNINSFLIDQSGHFIVLLAIWIWIINPKSEDIEVLKQIFLPGTKIWVIVAAYLVIIWPTSVLISKLTEKWSNLIEKEATGKQDESLEKAGRWIGWLERFLILTFVILRQYGAIGLLVAAKSIFRFSESRKVGEYVLIGTLLSFAIAILVGLIVSLFL
ncbi:MAG: DUF3307 domain-containing protein [Candidatus Methanoperedens sp.]|nr:DUF3307 domain-containing protein [Candidatus Methanoperedens sp.]CAG1001031.1 hypothetical protein METP1_02889 [Methanosarcinales archaeon]